MLASLAGSPKLFSMTDKIVVLNTCASQEEGERVARLLLDARLAACVSIVPGVESLYHWQGKIETSSEWLLIIKSTRERFAELRAAIEKAHSYDVPEVLALPVVDGAPNYLNWLDANVLKNSEGE